MEENEEGAAGQPGTVLPLETSTIQVVSVRLLVDSRSSLDPSAWSLTLRKVLILSPVLSRSCSQSSCGFELSLSFDTVSS